MAGERKLGEGTPFGVKNGERKGKNKSEESIYILNIYILLSLLTPPYPHTYMSPPFSVCAREGGEREERERNLPGTTLAEVA